MSNKALVFIRKQHPKRLQEAVNRGTNMLQSFCVNLSCKNAAMKSDKNKDQTKGLMWDLWNVLWLIATWFDVCFFLSSKMYNKWLFFTWSELFFVSHELTITFYTALITTKTLQAEVLYKASIFFKTFRRSRQTVKMCLTYDLQVGGAKHHQKHHAIQISECVPFGKIYCYYCL